MDVNKNNLNNYVNVKNNNTLFALDEPEKRFYFAHSYHVVCNNKKDILLTTDYGYSFTSSFRVGIPWLVVRWSHFLTRSKRQELSLESSFRL